MYTSTFTFQPMGCYGDGRVAHPLAGLGVGPGGH